MATADSVAIAAPRRSWRIPLLLGRVILGAIFLFAAYTKLHFGGAWHLRDYYFFFAMGIDSYKMLPLGVVEWMARILPWLEVALGSLLIIGIGLRWTASLTSVLLIVFMTALARAAILGLEINCGCFGNESTSPGRELIRDSALLLLALGIAVGAFRSHRAAEPRA